MIEHSMETSPKAVIVCCVAVSLALVLSGCGGKPKTPKTTGPTAKSSLAAAESAVSTIAPDAKLLVVQTAQPVTATDTPIWAYLFGSQKSGKARVVYAQRGKVLGATEAGEAGLADAEWSSVPDLDAWKVDSDEAYENARKLSGASASAAYYMGFATHIPKESTTTASAFVWKVIFDPETSGVGTKTIDVDATTGKASVSKE